MQPIGMSCHNTTEGTSFLSNDLNCCEYPSKVVNDAILLLSAQLSKDSLEIKEKAKIYQVKKIRSTPLSFKECQFDLYKYMSQEREDTYLITLRFEDLNYSFNLNEEGELMHEGI